MIAPLSTKIVDYPFSSRASNILRMVFGIYTEDDEFVSEPVATLSDLKSAIEAGEVSNRKMRGLGKTTMGEFIRATGAVPPVMIKIQKGWKFHPITGEPLP